MLTFDTFTKTAPEGKFFQDENKKVQRIIPPSAFSKLVQSPFLSKPAASPMTAAMELYNWLGDKTQLMNFFDDGEFRFDGCLTKDFLVEKFFRGVNKGLKI